MRAKAYSNSAPLQCCAEPPRPKTWSRGSQPGLALALDHNNEGRQRKQALDIQPLGAELTSNPTPKMRSPSPLVEGAGG